MNTSLSVSYKLLSSFKVCSKTCVMTPNLLPTKSKKKQQQQQQILYLYLYYTLHLEK